MVQIQPELGQVGHVHLGTLVQSAQDICFEKDKKFLKGERSPDGYYYVKAGKCYAHETIIDSYQMCSVPALSDSGDILRYLILSSRSEV